MDLPLEIKMNSKDNLTLSDAFLSGSRELDQNSTDSLFLKASGPCLTVGYLPDTSLFYSLVYRVSADKPIFYLITIDKEFKIIDNKLILNENGCTPAVPCLDCNTRIMFLSNNSIECTDSLYRYNCDSLGNSNGILTKTIVINKKMLIDKHGNIITKNEELNF